MEVAAIVTMDLIPLGPSKTLSKYTWNKYMFTFIHTDLLFLFFPLEVFFKVGQLGLDSGTRRKSLISQ